MNRLAMTLFAAVFCVATAGCPNWMKAPGAPFAATPVPEGKGVVYFYRPPTRIMSDYTVFMSIPLSANNCWGLESGGYTAHVVEPGEFVVAGAGAGYVTHTTQVTAGSETYVRVAFVDDEPTMTTVSASEGKAEIASLSGIETCTEKVEKK